MANHKFIIGDSQNMYNLEDESIHVIVTSPPYWYVKDYGVDGQIGFHDTYKEYIEKLNKVWKECYRVLKPGCRLCINIGDQYTRTHEFGRHKIIPIRESIIRYCESIEFDYMGASIWHKVGNHAPSGGVKSIMGSYPFPRNGLLKIEYEFVLVFKKLGHTAPPSEEAKEESRLSLDEWVNYFDTLWKFPGERQTNHIAPFPFELPMRLIKMFSFVGETVLDPFLGSGTTSAAAQELNRNSIGYEIDERHIELIKSRIGVNQCLNLFGESYDYEVIVNDK